MNDDDDDVNDDVKIKTFQASKENKNSKISLNPIRVAMSSISSSSSDNDYILLSGEMSDGAVLSVRIS